MVRTPCVRARYMQMFVARIDRLPEADRLAIRSEIPEFVWSAIASAGQFNWLPIHVNLVCTRAVSEQLVPERAHDFYRGLMLDASSTMLLGLVQSVLRVAVRDPSLYLPWVSKGFELLFRDTGSWKVVERRPGASLMELRGVPRECIDDPLWIQSAASALSALFDIARLNGMVAIERVDPAERRILFRSRWTPSS